MKNIKTYEKFINETFKSDKIDVKTQMFCEGRISESEYYEYLNEGIIDDIKNWISDVAIYTFDWFQKLGGVLLTLLKNAGKFGVAIGKKIIGAIKWVLDWINDWADKHPVAWRIIIITVIIFIIMIVCVASAHAQSTGQPIDHSLIDATIGFLRGLSGKMPDDSIRMKAMAYLVDLKGGTTHDVSVYGAEAIKMAKDAMSQIPSLAAKSQTPGELTAFRDFISKGAEVTKYAIETSGGRTNIILGK